MRILFKLLVVVALAALLGAAGAIYLAIEREPAVRRAHELTPANVQRARRVLDQNDPRNLRPGARRSVAFDERDLDAAANYLAHFYANGGARLILDDGKAEIRASLRPPRLPVIFYFNVAATLTPGSPLPRFAEFRVGELPIPGFIVNGLLRRAAVLLVGEEAIRAGARSIKRVDLGERQLTVVYEWSSDLKESLRGAAFTADELARLRVYQERLALINHESQTNPISLAELLVALFELAAERSRRGDPVAENRAAILVLAFYANGQPLDTMLPDARNWPRPTARTVTLDGRKDLAQHFIISAALAAQVGPKISDAVGTYKELDDARRGSGFSFDDIAADRAGTRFGERAANGEDLARKLQQHLIEGVGEDALMPQTDDLPKALSEAEFKRRFGGVGQPQYQRMIANIDRRIGALPLYRDSRNRPKRVGAGPAAAALISGIALAENLP